MTEFTAEQILERIANMNGVTPAEMLPKVEEALWNMILVSDRTKHTLEEWIVIKENDLYDVLMPVIPGWEWDGDGYRNLALWGKERH